MDSGREHDQENFAGTVMTVDLDRHRSSVELLALFDQRSLFVSQVRKFFRFLRQLRVDSMTATLSFGIDPPAKMVGEPVTIARKSAGSSDMDTGRVADAIEGATGDDLLLLSWKEVCRSESTVDPVRIIRKLFCASLDIQEEAQMFYICSPDRKCEPTTKILRALFPNEDERKFFAARVIDSDVRVDIIRACFSDSEYLLKYRGDLPRLVLNAFLKACDIFDDESLLKRFVSGRAYSPREFAVCLELNIEEVLTCAVGCSHKEAFVFLPLFRKIINCSKVGDDDELFMTPSSLFAIAVLHLAVSAGWEISEDSVDMLGSFKHEMYIDPTQNLPRSSHELRLAEKSLRVLLNLPEETRAPTIRPEKIGISHPNWYRSRFLQECLVRIGTGRPDLFAVDSPIVAEWIVTHGDVDAALIRYKAVRGNEFKSEDVQSCILKFLEGSGKPKKRRT